MVQGCTLPTEYAPKFKTTMNTELLPPAGGDISPVTLQTLSPNKQAAPVTQRAGTRALCTKECSLVLHYPPLVQSLPCASFLSGRFPRGITELRVRELRTPQLQLGCASHPQSSHTPTQRGPLHLLLTQHKMTNTTNIKPALRIYKAMLIDYLVLTDKCQHLL